MTTFLYANNAKTTLAGGITNVATTANLTSGSGVLFPTPSAGQQFALTFVDAATGLLNEIVYVTGRSGDTITIIRAQEGTTALAWSAGDIAASLFTAGNATQMLQPGSSAIRVRLVANTTFYASNTGSDSTGDGTSGNPWATMQHGINVLYLNYDAAGFTVTLKWNAAVTNTENLIINGTMSGVGLPSNFILDFNSQTMSPSATADCIIAQMNALVAVQNVTLTNTHAAGCLTAQYGAQIQIAGGVVFGSATGANHILAQAGGRVTSSANYTITGGANAHVNCNDSGICIILTGSTTTLTGTPAFALGYIFCNSNGFMGLTSGTFSGSATGPKYSGSLNGVIFTNGAGTSYFPGSTSGAVSTGAQYD